MRILLLTGDRHVLQDLGRALEARGHQVILATSACQDAPAAARPEGRLHVAVLSQEGLGKRWPKVLRQLRRQAPYLPAVLLMRPEAARAWRVAIRAGAFEALPESAPQETVLQAIARALAYAGGKSDGARPQLPNAAQRGREGEFTKTMTRRNVTTLWWGAGLLTLALSACSQLQGQTAATPPQTAEKTFPLKPQSVPVKVSFLVGQLQDLKVTERVERGTGKAVSSPDLRGMLKLKNGSADQAVQLIAGNIEYVDADGKTIPLAKEQGNTSFTFFSYQTETLNPGMETSQYVDVPFPGAALKGKKLQDIRLELSYIPTPY